VDALDRHERGERAVRRTEGSGGEGDVACEAAIMSAAGQIHTPMVD
jgi:hypothetical protein